MTHNEYDLMENPDSTEEIPRLDISDYLQGKAGALDRCAAQTGAVDDAGVIQLV